MTSNFLNLSVYRVLLVVMLASCSENLDRTEAGKACLAAMRPEAEHVRQLKYLDNGRVVWCAYESGMPFGSTYLVVTPQGQFSGHPFRDLRSAERAVGINHESPPQ